jgi:thioredoxin reductase (NADPH)
MNENPDVIIIGGGPAAMSSALYLLRAGKKVLILEKEAFGGQIAKSPRLENYPTIKCISGLEWSDKLFEQITDMGAEFDREEALSITKEGDTFTVKTNYNEHQAKAVIIAAGVKPRTLGAKNEDKLLGHGISYCAVCDGDFFTGKDVCLIGDANTALQYAMLLASKCRHVQIATLFDHFFADNILVEAMKKVPNISYRHCLETQEFVGEGSLTSVKFKDTVTKEDVEYTVDGCFIAIGQVPDNERFSNLLDLEKGFILTNDKMETKTPGLYAAGDCRVKGMRQVVTAVNDGAIAAVNAANYLNTLQ